CIADAKSLQTGALDQARRMVARRVREHRAAAPFADRLRLPAALQQFANRVVLGSGLAFELQARADEPFAGSPAHVAIADLVVGGRARMACAAPVECFHGDHVAPGLAAPGTGVHRERATEGARYAGKEFRGAEAPLHALPCNARAGHARAGLDARGADPLDRAERA